MLLMNLLYQIHRNGILVCYSLDITKHEFGAPTPSCFAHKQVNAEPY
jgi:hypothetical protein